MKGALHLIPGMVGVPHRFQEYDRPVSIKEMEELIGGPYELIPDLNYVQQNGALRECMAFVSAVGTRVKTDENPWAGILLILSLKEELGTTPPDPEQKIVGAVVIATGDREFLDTL